MKKIILLLALVMVSQISKADYHWLGDVNDDGKITKTDVELLVGIVVGRSPMPNDITIIDVNKDNKIDISDITALVDILLGKKEKTQVFVPDTVPIGGDKGKFD